MEHQEVAMHASKSVRRHVIIPPTAQSQQADHIVSVTRHTLYVLPAPVIIIVLEELSFGGDYATFT